MLEAVLTLVGIGLIASLCLGLAARKFAVKVDPRLQKLQDIVPNANCGACGFPGCSGFCEALLTGKAEINDCSVGDDDLKENIAGILGLDFHAAERRVATIRCQGMFSKAINRFEYRGVPSCRAAQMVGGGQKACTYGCLGFGDCLRACPFGAIELVDGLSRVSEDICTACGKCVRACPRDIIQIHPTNKKVIVLCCSHDKGGKVKKICQVGCIGCKKCFKTCPFEAINFQDFKSEIVWEKCTNCGLCASVCPMNAIGDACLTPLSARQLARKKIEEGSLKATCHNDYSAEGIGEPHHVEGFDCQTCGLRVDLDELGAPLIEEAEAWWKKRLDDSNLIIPSENNPVTYHSTFSGTFELMAKFAGQPGSDFTCFSQGAELAFFFPIDPCG